MIPALTRVDEIVCSEKGSVFGDQAMIPALTRVAEIDCSENRSVFGDQAMIPALTRVDDIVCSENRVVLGDQAMIPASKRLRTSPTHRDYANDEKQDPFFHDPSRKQTRTAHPQAATTPVTPKCDSVPRHWWTNRAASALADDRRRLLEEIMRPDGIIDEQFRGMCSEIRQ